jgi:hypothetical protein
MCTQLAQHQWLHVRVQGCPAQRGSTRWPNASGDDVGAGCLVVVAPDLESDPESRSRGPPASEASVLPSHRTIFIGGRVKASSCANNARPVAHLLKVSTPLPPLPIIRPGRYILGPALPSCTIARVRSISSPRP